MLLLAIDTAGPDCAVALAATRARRCAEILARSGGADRPRPRRAADADDRGGARAKPASPSRDLEPDRGHHRTRLLHRRPRRHRRGARPGAGARHSGRRRRQPRRARPSGRAIARAPARSSRRSMPSAARSMRSPQDLASGARAARGHRRSAPDDLATELRRLARPLVLAGAGAPLLADRARRRKCSIARRRPNRPTSRTSPRSASRRRRRRRPSPLYRARRRRQAASRQGAGAPMRPGGARRSRSAAREVADCDVLVGNPCEPPSGAAGATPSSRRCCVQPGVHALHRALPQRLRPQRRRPASFSTGSSPTRRRSSPSRSCRHAAGAASARRCWRRRCAISTARARGASTSRWRTPTRRRSGSIAAWNSAKAAGGAGYYAQGRETPGGALVMLRQLR